MVTTKDKTGELLFLKLCSKTNKGKDILRNLSGKFNSGSLIAIMGTSGSGKTTLLNILSGFNTKNASCEVFEINGNATNFESMSKISCYLTQDIHLNDSLTVEENLHFAANFKLGLSYSQIEKKTIVDELIHSFGLSATKHTRASKLSGGERKRLALALEMISDPQIIYLDEPTTGLDISTTNQILNHLKKIANSGKTVICAIHQLSACHFELFNYAYVIADGQCAYQGKPQNLVSFLDNLGLPCQIYHNPLDYLIELCSGDYGKDKAGILVQATHDRNMFSSKLSKRINSTQNDLLCYTNMCWRYQFKTLLQREYLKLSRNMLLLPLRILGSNFVCLSLGLLFWNVGYSASKILFIYNFALAVTASAILTGLLYPILSFSTQMELVKREVYNKYYSILQYYITLVALDLPISLTAISTSSMLAWYLSGQLLELDRILIYQMFMLTFGFLINMVGLFFGTLNFPISTLLCACAVTQLPMMVISGYAMHFHHMYWLFEYLGRLTYIRNGLQGCLVSMLGLTKRKLECLDEDDFCIYTEPHRLLIDVGIDPFHYASCLYNLIIWLCIVMVSTYFMMKFRLSC